MATPKKLPSGRWRCLIYVGKDENGKRKYRSVTADTKKEAVERAAQIENRPQNASKMTVGEAVRHYIDIRENVLSPATVRGYEKIFAVKNFRKLRKKVGLRAAIAERKRRL
jgi:hypothetical protein